MNIKRTLLVTSLFLSTSLISCGRSVNSQVPNLEVSEYSTSKKAVPKKSQLSEITTKQGWKKLQGEGVELQLPKSYEGGNPKKDYKEIRKKVETLGNKSNSITRTLSRKTSAFFAFDSQGAKTGNFTNVIIVKDKMPRRISLKQLTNALAKRMSKGDRKLIDKEIISLDNYQAGKIITQKGEAQQMMYLIKDGQNSWGVIYTTTVNNFERHSPTFQESINTLRITTRT